MKVVKSIWKLAEHNCILSLERNKLNNNCSENTRNIIEGPYTKPFHPRAMTANDIPERVALAITFGFLIQDSLIPANKYNGFADVLRKNLS